MTVRIAKKLGLEEILNLSKKLNIYNEIPELLSVSLGAAETTLISLTSAYAPFVNGGKKIEPKLISRIQDRRGKTIFQLKSRKCIEAIRKDRARMQIGRISTFGLLEMTRQRLREGSIKWETQLSLPSFSQKILKKIQLLAFKGKVKIINSYVPEKVKTFIETNLLDELKYFQKKYSFEVKILSNDKFIIPEYKIELLNKSKKLINKIENIHSIIQVNKIRNNFKTTSVKDKKVGKIKNKDKKTIIKKKRTLWTRKKKKS